LHNSHVKLSESADIPFCTCSAFGANDTSCGHDLDQEQTKC
jgi:hypothetical protein